MLKKITCANYFTAADGRDLLPARCMDLLLRGIFIAVVGKRKSLPGTPGNEAEAEAIVEVVKMKNGAN